MTLTQTRRNSSAYPYPIPAKQGYKHHLHNHPHGHNSHNDKLSASVPTFSRDFVVRRISEGETGRLKELLRCEACGKAYKHISSLAKHLWEHTPEWTMTKKLLISKHQQVQLLEAASILVGMNEPGSACDDSTHSSYTRAGYLNESFENDGDELLFSDSIPSSYSPMPGCVGGYIDVPSREFVRPRSQHRAGDTHQGSISDAHRGSISDAHLHRGSISDAHRGSMSDAHLPRGSISDSHHGSVSDAHLYRGSISDAHRGSISDPHLHRGSTEYEEDDKEGLSASKADDDDDEILGKME